MDAEDLRTRVRAARKRRKWSQGKLSEVTGISVRTLSAFENGETKKMQPANLRAIARALDIPLDEPMSVVPDDDDEMVAARTRAQWPDDVVVFADVLSQWLSTLSDEERRHMMGVLFRWIMDRGQGNQLSS